MESPFAPYLGTNYSPSDEEVLKIKSLLVEPTLRLRHLDSIIANLQKAIDKIAEERDAFAAYVEAHKALIPPIRRIPLDVIREIFIACLPTHRNCVMSVAEALVLLGRICSPWRAILLSTPRLWASLHVVEPPRPSSGITYALAGHKAAQRIAITKTWLGRSGQCPLSISLHSATESGSATAASASSIQFLQSLISFAPRWQHIHFTTPATLLLEILSYVDIDMPLLETVTFRHQDHRPLHDINCGAFNMLRGARISSFSIPGSIFITERFPLAWNQLTTLEIGGPSWTVSRDLTVEMALRVISRCPELRCCKLVVSNFPLTEMISVHYLFVELPLVHTFAIHSISHEYSGVTVLLNHLSLPGLRNFTYLGSSQNPPALSDFFEGLTCLESVDIDINIFPNTSLMETLSSLPRTIQRLRVRDNRGGRGNSPRYLDDNTLEFFTSPAHVPALEDLFIDHGVGISEAAVLRFITARMGKTRNTLKRVDIHFTRQMGLDSDIMPSLQPFIERGLSVSLSYSRVEPSLYSTRRGLADGTSSMSSLQPDW
ncbi:hypothetical protein K438DRAFT_1880989 [Mycena galopus ATCC 62051]|nr:hypothetical protein K438DRAFT_1880989 [Mycena galopus ATCC 62051]